MQNHLLGFLVPMAGILAIANPASALTSSLYSANYSGLSPVSTGNNPGSVSVSLQGFDSSLGTLTGVSLTFTGSTQFYVDETNFADPSNASRDANGEPDGLNGISETLSVYSSNQNDLADGTSTVSGLTGDYITTHDEDLDVAVNTSAFTGSTFSQPVSLDSSLFYIFENTGNIALSVITNGDKITQAATGSEDVSLSLDSATASAGQVTVKYTYTAPVPFDFSPNQLGLSLVPLLFGIRLAKKKIAG